MKVEQKKKKKERIGLESPFLLNVKILLKVTGRQFLLRDREKKGRQRRRRWGGKETAQRLERLAETGRKINEQIQRTLTFTALY